MTAELTRGQATALTELVALLRPDWHRTGIMAALGQVKDRDPYEVTIAAVRAAAVATNRTPAVIPLPGPHWDAEGKNGQEKAKPGTWSPADARFCERCSSLHHDNEPCIRPQQVGDYERGAAAARAALQAQQEAS